MTVLYLLSLIHRRNYGDSPLVLLEIETILDEYGCLTSEGNLPQWFVRSFEAVLTEEVTLFNVPFGTSAMESNASSIISELRDRVRWDLRDEREWALLKFHKQNMELHIDREGEGITCSIRRPVTLLEKHMTRNPGMSFGLHRCGQSVPEFAFVPHVVIEPSPDLYRWLAEHCHLKVAPWPMPVDTTMLDEYEIIPEDDPPFSAWSSDCGQEFLQRMLSCAHFMQNDFVIVDARLDEHLLSTTIPDYFWKSSQELTPMLPYIASRLGFAGLQLPECGELAVFVFSEERKSDCEALITWAKQKEIMWGVLIPSDNPINIEGPIFHRWGYV